MNPPEELLRTLLRNRCLSSCNEFRFLWPKRHTFLRSDLLCIAILFLARLRMFLEDLAFPEVSAAIVHSINDAYAAHARDMALIKWNLDKGAWNSFRHGVASSLWFTLLGRWLSAESLISG